MSGTTTITEEPARTAQADGPGQAVLPPSRIGAARIVTARSHLIDRIVADCEIVSRPPFDLPGAELSWRCAPGTRPAVGRKALFRAQPPHTEADPARILVDLRRNAPQNWAHFLNNHLPLVFHFAERLDLDPARIIAVIPGDAPKYIHAAAALFGVETLATAGSVSGTVLSYDVDPWDGIRSVRYLWARTAWPARKVASILSETPARPLPRRVFLSRRDTRRLSNLSEIEPILTGRGFETVHAEDLSAADQVRLILGAEEIVAVHGAALAPLLYAGAGGSVPPRRIVELMPCGHMTNVYRVMAEQVGSAWIGVRGRIKPEYVRSAYDLEAPFKAYSLDDFEIDPAALDLAIALSEGRAES